MPIPRRRRLPNPPGDKHPRFLLQAVRGGEEADGAEHCGCPTAYRTGTGLISFQPGERRGSSQAPSERVHSEHDLINFWL